MKMVRFTDADKNTFGGIILPNGNILCGCCGSIFEKEDFENDGITIEEELSWVSISDEILGDI